MTSSNTENYSLFGISFNQKLRKLLKIFTILISEWIFKFWKKFGEESDKNFILVFTRPSEKFCQHRLTSQYMWIQYLGVEMLEKKFHGILENNFIFSRRYQKEMRFRFNLTKFAIRNSVGYSKVHVLHWLFFHQT